jgi:hypothetical protein
VNSKRISSTHCSIQFAQNGFPISPKPPLVLATMLMMALPRARIWASRTNRLASSAHVGHLSAEMLESFVTGQQVRIFQVRLPDLSHPRTGLIRASSGPRGTNLEAAAAVIEPTAALGCQECEPIPFSRPV